MNLEPIIQSEVSQKEKNKYCMLMGSPIAQLVKNPPQCRRPWFNSWVGKIHWRRDRLPTPVFLGFPYGPAGKKIHLQCERPEFDSWVGKIPWRREELPTSVFWTGEFHGLCIVHGVTKRWTQLSDFHFPLTCLDSNCSILPVF